MTRFGSELTSSSASAKWWWFGLALIAYLLPWVMNRGAGLTLGAYDLAEWASLHPATQAGRPALLNSLLLRLPPVGLVLALVLSSTGRAARWPDVGLVWVTAVALLPPLEFFRQASSDPNYQQQLALAGLTLIAGLAGLLVPLPTQWRRWLPPALTLVAATAGLVGLTQTHSLLTGFALPTQVGIGGVLFALASLALCAVHVIAARPDPKSANNKTR